MVVASMHTGLVVPACGKGMRPCIGMASARQVAVADLAQSGHTRRRSRRKLHPLTHCQIRNEFCQMLVVCQDCPHISHWSLDCQSCHSTPVQVIWPIKPPQMHLCWSHLGAEVPPRAHVKGWVGGLTGASRVLSAQLCEDQVPTHAGCNSNRHSQDEGNRLVFHVLQCFCVWQSIAVNGCFSILTVMSRRHMGRRRVQ